MKIQQFSFENRTFLVLKKNRVNCTNCIVFQEKKCELGSVINKYCLEDDRENNNFWKTIILNLSLKAEDLVDFLKVWRF